MSSPVWGQLKLDPQHRLPLYKQISQQTEQMVHEGKLKPGVRLPSERKMAEILQVSRMTITLAYEDMKARGILRSQQGSGTFIMRGPRIERSEQAVTWHTQFAYETGNINYAMEEVMRFGRDPKLIPLAGVGTAPEVHPGIELSQFFAEHLRRNPILLQLPTPTQGYEPLRHDLLGWLEESGIHAAPEETMIVSGAMQGLDLISRLFLGPGDYVIMEDPGLPAASDAFTASGAKILRITLDQQGIRTESLENLLMQFPVKFIYVNPTFHNPTGITMSLERREHLLSLAKKYRVPIVEDDPTSLLFYGSKPTIPLKAMDRDDLVIYLRTFSKYVFPGLRVAVLVAPEAIVTNLLKVKQRIDLHSNNLSQIAVHAFLMEGRLERHLERLRSAYASRIALLREVIGAHPDISCHFPEGGVFLWCKLPSHIRAERLLQIAIRKGVAFVPGNWLSGVGLGDHYFRLAFTHPSLDLLKEGLKQIDQAIAEHDSYQC
ncbi:PLP-dependent aminotransferase family protein [Brevibacillus humidisoli]|uniref:MocR-like pyridoxine biosynthesis transcription factor PdxR n=1 Tax=Brevibacillus humidisoli TaxID=2895522 RepID=UPI001E6204BB|nr:PLP-dependent aminotransferase family protein [Brevibacillus humidisoli]UFJ40867.1 PLP-dependent aminotransferase family protein [Brevibacillus humidisoli]